MIGKTVGKYRILDRLGRGGMGTVYRAVDETLDREVAIKVLNPDLGDPDVLRRFRAEAMTLARLSHPGIATIYELHRQDDDLLMVMEFVRGETLHAMSERIGKLAVPQAAHLCAQVLDALAHAHRAGIIHRDLKPANVMIADSGTVKVMDFGIARILGSEHVTQGGYMMGTPSFMAPEQVLGHDVDARTDLYSVGVVLYRLLAGDPPFKAETSIAIAQKHISEQPTPISRFRPDLPPWCIGLIDRALAKAPSDRFQSADEFRAALVSAAKPEALGELTTMATPAPTARPSPAAVADVPTRATTPAAAAAPSPTPAIPQTHGTTTLVLGRTHLVTLAALVAVLVAGIVVLAFLALRRDAFPLIGSKSDVPAAVPNESKQAASAVPPVAAPPPPTVPSTTTAAAPPPSPPGDRKQAEASAPKASSAAVESKAPARAENAPAAPAPAGETAGTLRGANPPVEGPRGGRLGRGLRGAETGRAGERVLPTESATPLVVENVRFAQHEPGRGPARERDGTLRLGDGQLTVMGRDRSPLVTAPYGAMAAAFISKSLQPRWRMPDGSDVGGRVDVGRAFFRGPTVKNWLIVIVRNQPPIVLRLSDDVVRTVVTELNARSGVPVQRVVPR
jgi:serine/threonine-protein kinase